MWTWILLQARIFLFSVTTDPAPGTICPASWDDPSQSVSLGPSHTGHAVDTEDLVWAADISSTATFREQSPSPALGTVTALQKEQDLVHPQLPAQLTELLNLADFKDRARLYICTVYYVNNNNDDS